MNRTIIDALHADGCSFAGRIFSAEVLPGMRSPGISSRQVTRVLERVMQDRGKPETIRCDNGPEFTSRHFLAWCAQKKISLVHIQPGRPTAERICGKLNGRLRDECLNANWFVNLADAKQKIESWRQFYNADRPHSSLDYRKRLANQRRSGAGAMVVTAGFAA